MVLSISIMHQTLCPRISYPCLMGGCLVTRWPVNTHNIIMSLLDDSGAMCSGIGFHVQALVLEQEKQDI